MPWENIGECGSADLRDRLQMTTEVALGACIAVVSVLGEPPPGTEVGTMWHEHDLGSYATVGLCWEPSKALEPPWKYIERAERVLSWFEAAINWSTLWEGIEAAGIDGEDEVEDDADDPEDEDADADEHKDGDDSIGEVSGKPEATGGQSSLFEPKVQPKRLRRGGWTVQVDPTEWAEILMFLSLRGWEPGIPSHHLLASNLAVSAAIAASMRKAGQAALDAALADPASVLPVAFNMGKLAEIVAFCQDGAFEIDQ